MNEIYPAEESRRVLTVFRIYEGTGEWFNMGNGNIEHHEFSFGGAELSVEGYYITGECTKCGICIEACPRNAISLSDNGPAFIDRAHCIKCGNCLDACPANAIVRNR